MAVKERKNGKMIKDGKDGKDEEILSVLNIQIQRDSFLRSSTED